MKTCRSGKHEYEPKNKKNKQGCPHCYKSSLKRNYDENSEKWIASTLKSRAKNPRGFKNATLLYKYGITIEEFDYMVNKQQNLCAICNKPETKLNNKKTAIKDLAVDHCHTSGKVRGLLCSKCNNAIGLFKEDAETILKAASYVAMGGI